MNGALAGSMVLALAFATADRASAEGSAQLTADQQSIVVLSGRQELSSPRNKGWKPSAPLCLRVRVGQDGEEESREVRIPPELLRRLNTGSRTVVPVDRCIKSGDQDVRYRAPGGRAAYLLDVAIFLSGKGAESARVEVNLTDRECVPLACNLTTWYDAERTKRGWTVEYNSQMSD
jgi:hypothetical protein